MRIAIITPWFGKNLSGGAEQYAWQLANRLAERGHSLDVLTTCCRSFADDWAQNHFTPGNSTELGMTIRRFLVDSRDVHKFDDLNGELLSMKKEDFIAGTSPVSVIRSRIWATDNINSAHMMDFIKTNKEKYEAFLFIPYLYGPVINGIPLVSEKAWLIPCLHDESYAYLNEIQTIFYLAEGILFLSEGERDLSVRLYGPGIINKSFVIGGGIEIDYLSSSKEALPNNLTGKRYLLCIGRRDPTKGINRLIKLFMQYRTEKKSSQLHLVLAGPGDHDYSEEGFDIIDLGFVSQEEKVTLLSNSLVLCQPSANEAFSRVLFESWYCGKPAIVNGECFALSTAVRNSNGGWIATTDEEWLKSISEVDEANPEYLYSYGIRGKKYSIEFGDWQKVLDRCEILLKLPWKIQSNKIKIRSRIKSIHQLLPNLDFGDAISNEAIILRNWLRGMGYSSEIFVRYYDQRVSSECHCFEPGIIKNDDGLIYHHSIGNEITPHAITHKGPKCLVYHNITPANFFEPYRPDFAEILRQGRDLMNDLSVAFPVSVGDSEYNAKDLFRFGFHSPGVLPICVDPDKWQIEPDPILLKRLHDGSHNIVFIGRYAPNKCQHDLIEAFYYYLSMDENARLILVGSSMKDDPYLKKLEQEIAKFHVFEHVLFLGQIEDSQLHAIYRSADLFWSMSEHEGFCVPLVEAMWFDIPILAYKSSAIPETLGNSGIMFTEKSDLCMVAALAKIIVSDSHMRQKILMKQKIRRSQFSPKEVYPCFEKVVEKLEKYKN